MPDQLIQKYKAISNKDTRRIRAECIFLIIGWNLRMVASLVVRIPRR